MKLLFGLLASISVIGLSSYYLIPKKQPISISQVSTNAAPISGTFISFVWGLTSQFTPEQLQSEFEDMSAIGINTIIIAGVHTANFGHYNLPDTTHYNLLDSIFKLAAQYSMRVYFAPVDYYNYFSSPENTANLDRLSKKYATEIAEKGYTNKPEFSGWYITQEFLLNTDDQNFSNIRSLVDHYKIITPNKKVIASPYYLSPCYPGKIRCTNQWWPNKTPAEMAENAKKFMQATNVDIMAIQDGVGSSGITTEELNQYLPAINQAVTSIGKEFWVDAETFRMTVNSSAQVPAKIDSLVEQMNTVKKYPVVIWLYHYLSRQNNTASQTLFNDYVSHYNITLPSPMHYYNTQYHACGTTQASYTDINTCQTNLGLYMPGLTTGICYRSLTECETANPKMSPSPTTKPGDLNGDGLVNIFDFNLLVSQFGNPYTIFDFNNIVANFGK